MRAAYFIVALSLTSCHPVYAKEFAIANNSIGGQTVLTDDTCRFDKTLPEAYTTDAKGNRAYGCYWFGSSRIYFQTQDGTVRSMPKKDFDIIDHII